MSTVYIKDLEDCKEFLAGDSTILRELLHPDKADFPPLSGNFRYSLAHAVVKPGMLSKPHKLKTSEVYYILEGKGLMHINTESKEVFPHQVIYIPPNSLQYIENTGNSDLKFLCIVDPAWRAEDEEVL